ncbi:protein-disulfide reductase DsbD [Marinomonas sp. C2222]|uniref:Protein-disulfide reductase DsbD n=1 Tax=Marinomonas sargassi TaxID=2984494 RepID=A0ABT2YTV5_9GAMM|nr:protein-disulfide reductase DsbD [Marinomonas sargassi]MCV2403300.1 protein-disulfide reductase DsbD [Marinomonas sargassi]
MRPLIFLLLLFIQSIAHAFTFAPTSSLTKPSFLPVEQAFQFSLSTPKDGKILASWTIHEGYYLYQEQFRLSGKNKDKLHFSHFPDAETKNDPYFGDVQIYRNTLTLPIYYDINLPVGSEIDATLSYQGCADQGLCYAPQNTPISFTVPELSADARPSPDNTKNGNTSKASTANSIAPSETQAITETLKSSSIWIALGTLFLLGLLLSLTPCVLPMVPIVSAIVVGTRDSRMGAFYYSFIYVLAMALTYSLIGGLVGIFGLQLNLQAQLQSPLLLATSSVIFVLLALAMFGVYELRLPSSWQNKLQVTASSSQSLWRTSGSTFIAGVLSTLIVSPCVSAPLVGTLLYISGQGDAWYGALMLFTMGVGMGIPLLLVGLFGSKVLPKNGEWLQDIKNVMGLGLLAVSAWLMSRWIPEHAQLFLWGLLALSIGSYFIHRAYNHSHPIRWLIAITFLLIGIMEFIGGAMGNKEALQPLKSTYTPNSTETYNTVHFDASIGSLEELQRIISNQDDRPIVLDLYADWCISCRYVEAMFASPEALPLTKQVQLVRVDVTQNSQENREIMKAFSLFGPPSIVFLDPQGKELKQLTLIGEPTQAELIERLQFAVSQQLKKP